MEEKAKELNQEFFEEYKKFEEYFKNKHNISENSFDNFIEKDNILKRNSNFWYKYRNFRNLFAHKPINEKFYISESALNEFKKHVKNILKPLTADNMRNTPYIVKESTNLCDVLSEMKMNNFSNVPIIDDNSHVIGMFNYYTMFQYFNNNCDEIIAEPKKMIIKDFEKFYGLDCNPEIIYKFISRRNTIHEIYEFYLSENTTETRLDVFLVTENGKETEKLLGIITAYDILKHVSDM